MTLPPDAHLEKLMDELIATAILRHPLHPELSGARQALREYLSAAIQEARKSTREATVGYD